MSFDIYYGDCRKLLKGLKTNSVDAVISDPPYPEVDRPYGKLSVEDWFSLMRDVVTESERVLTPFGSAVFVLQPNSEQVGIMRPWPWEFVTWAMKEWNLIQDVYWWNPASLPSSGAGRHNGLMRPSVKMCVWLGRASCYRNQNEVLWTESDSAKAEDRSDRALRKYPSGHSKRTGRMARAADERGGGDAI